MPYDDYDDRELLARLIMCEAGGEGEIGMRAVATVVMNRTTIDHGEFGRVNQGGNLRNIVFQPGQFDCAWTEKNGVPNPQNIYNMRPTEIHFEIADWALTGGRLPGVDHSLYFYNPFSLTCAPYFPPPNYGVIHNRIGDHCFYIPTVFYPST
ncbi:MAG: cell wall hydrolase [Clostridiales bacterium]|nr:cell wall hydrolase [Clostridiales bacterium]